MTGSVLVAVALFAPMLAALGVMALKPAGLGAGRMVTIGCAVASSGAVGAVVTSGVREDGLVGDAGGWALHADRASALLLAAVVATGLVVASFSRRSVDLDPRGGRFFVLLGALVTGSGLVVVHGSALALVLGWIGSTWALVALVGHRSELAATGHAQRVTARALLVGDVALLLAVALVVLVGQAGLAGDVALAAANLGSSSVLGVPASDLVALLLIVAGASRSALVPWHRWLVVTLAAPTPVSALVHAGFVSGAGLLMIRFHSVILNSPVAVHTGFFLAVATVLVGVGAGSLRADIKGKLAWSTVSQMGFMVVQASVGALSSAVLHIIGHGMYKASMFLGAGDAISNGLRGARRAAPLPVMGVAARMAWSGAVASVALALGLWILPPEVSRAGVVLVAVFAWSTAAHGLWGWLSRGAMSTERSVMVGSAGAIAAVFGYLAGLRVMERFLEPSLSKATAGSGVGATTLLVTMGVILLVAAIARAAQRPVIAKVRDRVGVVLARTAHPGVAGLGVPRRKRASVPRTAVGSAGSPSPVIDKKRDVSLSQIRADVTRASAIVAPSWPLTSFVAVNPLGGLEHLGFDAATAAARQQLRVRTHLTLADFRADHERGLSTAEDLAWAIESHFVDVCTSPGIRVGGREVSAAEVVRLDMLHGPEWHPTPTPTTALERAEGASGPRGQLIDAAVCHSAVQFVALAAQSGLKVGAFHAQWRRDAMDVAELRGRLSDDARQWLRALSADPAEVIESAFEVTGVDKGARIAEMRGHMSRIRGWSGHAKWRTDWAHPDEHRPKLTVIDIVAARAALEAACLLQGREGVTSTHSLGELDDSPLTRRVDAVLGALEADNTREAREAVHRVLAEVDPAARNAAWLTAQERRVERDLLSQLDRVGMTAAAQPPAAQLVFCIDVRSEGLRRHLEALGPYDTLGFAGFFGVAMSVRRLEWNHAEARSPVLVTPSVRAVETPPAGLASSPGIGRRLARDRVLGAAHGVHSFTKSGAGAPFVMAEAAGWFAGPVAAARTFLPRRSKPETRTPTSMQILPEVAGGLDHEQRVFTAETVLRTMGLTEGFARLVVLCGHASPTVNNPHATALDCGACAGASGEDNARAVASLMNEADVRRGLRERGIDLPDTTHVTAGLHNTVSDRVEILDRHEIPDTHLDALERLTADLDAAARRQSADRALDLPGRSAGVANRGNDWAQIRPEWGLARNSSFIIGPRSMTKGIDLKGRSFLHTYHADLDPDGRVLETIMTAPLVVAHWISSQYYFSTVDPEAFGAGDKLLHNVVGDTGVIQGEQSDLRVGLPLQSTHSGDHRRHQPVRLLAVIEAPFERIERIIDENPILRTLVGGAWIRIAGRSQPHEPWSIRTPHGTWSAEPRAVDTAHILETP